MATTTKRPSDRKEQIADAAARLFCDLGYHGVGIHEIAASVGITGRAIYRHFESKEDLLAHTVLAGVRLLEGSVDGDLDTSLVALTALAAERRYLGVLLRREARHLDDTTKIRERTGVVSARLERALRSERPELSDEDAAFLVRSVFAVLASPSYHSVVLADARTKELLREMVSSVLTTKALPRKVRSAKPPPEDESERASQRERLLSAAITLFARNGYPGVRMEDVGAAVGMTGPSIYQYFASKADILVAALTRGAEWLQFGISRALGDVDPYRSVVASYVDFVLTHQDLMSVFLSETIYLPDDARHALRRLQHDYVAEWVKLLEPRRPELTEAERRFVTHGVLEVVNDNVRGRSVSASSEVLTDLGLEVFSGRKA